MTGGKIACAANFGHWANFDNLNNFFRYRVVFIMSQTVYMCIIIESFEKPCSSMQFIKALSGSTSHVRIISGAASRNKIIISSYTNITYMYSNKLVIFSGIGLYYDDTCVLQAYSAPCVQSYQNTTLHTQDIESQQRTKLQYQGNS